MKRRGGGGGCWCGGPGGDGGGVSVSNVVFGQVPHHGSLCTLSSSHTLRSPPCLRIRGCSAASAAS
ncbi:hypothetical protein KIN20_005320 [Parelaphostrongylus tenuis]|uniref:Uncharacterized protein n=1 Tax=Parelaphostrongylus tenuis TaxID=148309 RepID=A0AAD5M200_PARTN|nr:hypothetical protein KIN20_005320 [Parelaphostrongylus tenuis]